MITYNDKLIFVTNKAYISYKSYNDLDSNFASQALE